MESKESLFCGRFKLQASDNFDDFLKKLGINFMLRKLAVNSCPVVCVKHSQDLTEFEIKSETHLKTNEIKFKINEYFDEKRLDGTLVKSIVEIDRDTHTLVQRQYDQDREITYERTFTPTQLIVIASIGDTVCKRVYERLESDSQLK